MCSLDSRVLYIALDRLQCDKQSKAANANHILIASWAVAQFFFITEDSELFAWGLNQHGQCGVGELTDRLKSEVDTEGFRVSGSNWILNVYQPLVVKGLPAVSEVCCGWSHVLAVTGE